VSSNSEEDIGNGRELARFAGAKARTLHHGEARLQAMVSETVAIGHESGRDILFTNKLGRRPST
jgi:hypothetical protein